MDMQQDMQEDDLVSSWPLTGSVSLEQSPHLLNSKAKTMRLSVAAGAGDRVQPVWLAAPFSLVFGVIVIITPGARPSCEGSSQGQMPVTLLLSLSLWAQSSEDRRERLGHPRLKSP